VSVWRQARAAWKGLFRDDAFREKLRFLRGVLFFQGLGERALALVAHTMMQKDYAQGEVIFQEGDVGRAFFVVVQGRVRLTYSDKRTQREKLLADMDAGDSFGEMALLDELPRSATARAVEPARLYILYKSQFDGLLLTAPGVASKVLHTLARLLSARLRRERSRAEHDAPADAVV
jgi:CRP-like cAMP-binding protein